MNRLEPWFDPHDDGTEWTDHRDATVPRDQLLAAWEAFTAIELGECVPPRARRTAEGRPLRVALPEPYEPKYAYPLVVWLHGRGGDECDVLDVLPRISDQNFLGLGFRGNRADDERGRRFGWDDSNAAIEAFEGDLYDTLCEARQRYHVHSERIFVAGFDAGAALALRLLVRHPEWFGGGLAFCPDFGDGSLPLTRFRDLGGQRVLVAGGNRGGIGAAVSNAATARMLEAAGMLVTNRVYDAGRELADEMLSDANHWILDAMCAAV